MKAKKLPSGSWRCQVYWYTDQDGKKHYKSFTNQDPSAKGKRACEAEASAWALSKSVKTKSYQKTFSDALEQYIKDRESILSPASIRKYRGMQRNHFEEINDMVLSEISQDDVQKMVNRMMSENYSAKTIWEVTSMVSTVQKRNNINPFMNTVKPKKRAKKKIVPTDEQICELLKCATGTEMYLPIMLAAFCGLRRGECAAVESSDLVTDVLHIHRNMVDRPGGGWIIKEPKTEDGDRYVPVPECIINIWPSSGRVTTLNPGMITSRFEHIVNKCNLPAGITFHSLRHYTTSIKLMLGENDLVVRKEMGWSEKDFLQMKEIYGHTVKGHEFSEKTCKYFDSITQDITRK